MMLASVNHDMRQHIIKLVADGFYKEAISLYSQLHSSSLPPHHFTFPPLLKACAKLKSTLHGQIIHAHLIKTGFHSDVYTATALTHMYMKLNLLNHALRVFDEMTNRNLASLNAAISGFSQNRYCEEAFLAFREVGLCGFRPNSLTVASVLPACDSADHCMQMHCWAIKLGVEMDIYVATSLVTMYSNCGEVIFATRIFREMPNRNVVSHNAFVSGLLQNGVPSIVLHAFKDMRECSIVKPNSVTLVSVISACACLLYLQYGRQIHGFIKKTLASCDAMVGTALVDMYSKCGYWQWAYEVFNELNDNKNLITWNSMIAGMMLNGQSDNAVELFERLASEGLEPDSITWNSMISGFAQLENGIEAFNFFKRMQFCGVIPSLKSVTSLLSACAALSALQYGKVIHGHATRTNIDTDEFLATTLIDMYMKCGYSSWGRRVFDQFEIKPKDPALWNALISGYGRNGENYSVFEVFDQMLEEKVKPNSATFIAVLSACSHMGEVEKGAQVFRMMSIDYGLKPKPEHFGCMVDMLGRFGKLDEARKIIEEMLEPPSSVFASLLGACRHHLHSELGEEMAMKLSELEPGDPNPLVILSEIYAALGRWEDVDRIRQTIKDRGLRKLPGYSLIGVT
ncbi:hypothetical protein JCGZ_21690 [Jatropha curcas]|uniref:Uncharacterized protein n=1 Tax=Jatropha curcas TaxID=180498 RepID=A0A067JNZ7_JATCU|nr:pentatricopeptide repeat-containing protein At2g02750 [Jatropha curcas]KDP21219.1 hypothetical protein JCGZ_21690 [Jatropha curcas]